MQSAIHFCSLRGTYEAHTKPTALEVPITNVFGTTTEERLVEAKDRAWLGEVAALEEGIKHLRMKKSEA